LLGNSSIPRIFSLHLSGASSILGAINFICTSAGLGCFYYVFIFLPNRHFSSQRSEKYGSPYEEVNGFRVTMSSANNTIISCGVPDIVKGKATNTKLKPTIVARRTSVSFRRSDTITSLGYTLCKKDAGMRVHYSTDTRSNSKSTSGDQRNGSLVPIGNEPNGEANKKNKD